MSRNIAGDFISRRLLGNGKVWSRQPGIVIARVAIALAVTVMMLSISIVGGFKREIEQKVMMFEAPLGIYPGYDSEGRRHSYMAYDSVMADIVDAKVGDSKIYGVVDVQLLLKTDSSFAVLNLKCLPNDYDMAHLKGYFVSGGWYPSDSVSSMSSIAVSAIVAKELGLKPGSRLTAFVPGEDGLKARPVRIGAIYDTHFSEYDQNMAYGNMTFARNGIVKDSALFSAVEIRSSHGEFSERVKDELYNDLMIASLKAGRREMPIVQTTRERGASFFNWLELLDVNVIVILVLMSVVSAFTLVSALFILILERVNMIGLLKALGARSKAIGGIFMAMGRRVVLSGVLWGNLIALVVILIQYFTHAMPLDADAYYMDFVPVSVDLPVFICLDLGVILLSFAVLVIPSGMISRMKPVDALRYIPSENKSGIIDV